ncbi:MAG: thiamine phosphate synthase [Chthoniobacterales bacterium]
MRNLTDCYLYGILDLGYVAPARIHDVAEALIAGGVDVLQLRGKNVPVPDLIGMATELHELTAASDVPLVINDHPTIACEVPVEGVHVGQDDEAIGAVREIVGRPIWVGKSTHSVTQAVAAEREGADYIGFGPVYATPTKRDYTPVGLNDIDQVRRLVKRPIFCIGGIKLQNLPMVIAAGARRVVIVSGLLLADDITEYARSCRNLLQSAPQPASA